MSRPLSLPLDRFNKQYQILQNGCWDWIGYKESNGYGRILVKKDKWEHISAHRFAYEQFVSAIPNDKVIDHICRNRGCVNPAHMRVVTTRENILIGEGLAAKNAKKTHCPKGHIYDEENTIFARGRRKCRECNKEQCRKYKSRISHEHISA